LLELLLLVQLLCERSAHISLVPPGSTFAMEETMKRDPALLLARPTAFRIGNATNRGVG